MFGGSIFPSFLAFITCALTWPGVSAATNCQTDSVTNGTELVFAFLIHRHGDRTPVKETLTLVKNKDDKKIEELIKPWGLGQLTDVGRRTGFNIGKFIRSRYNDIIDKRYNKSEIYIRSTDSTRVKMTVLTAMSAVFSASDDPWSDVINWTPVPYTTVPVKYDYNEAFINCPKYMNYYYSSMKLPNSRMDVYKGVMKKVSKLIGYDITQQPVLISQVYDLFQSLISLGYDLGDDLKKLMPKIINAAGVSWDITVGDRNYLSLQAGVLLKEFFDNSKAIIAGKDTEKVRIYGAHDINVYSLEAISKAVPLQGVPGYGSLFSLELRRVKETGKYVVLPVYLADPNEGSVKYLQINGCGDSFLCDYHTFRSITSSYILDEDTWRARCDFSEDLDIDSNSID